MFSTRRGILFLALLLPVLSTGCASSGTGGGGERERSDLLTREQIMGVEATNLFDAIRRLRPRWVQIRSTRSFEMETEIVVIQNDSYMGPVEILKELGPEVAYEVQYLEGSRAATALPGLMSGRHIEGAIIIRTRPIG